MYLTDETYRAVIVAAIQAQGGASSTPETIKETVGALIAADRKAIAYQLEGG